MSKIFYSIAETAEVTGLSAYFVRSGCRDGSIPCVRSGVKFLIHLPAFLEQLDALASQGKELPRA